MKILVTGGAGYIGSVTVEQLADAGHEVVVYDSLYKGYADAVDKRATFVKADLADRAAIHEALREHQIEAVMHFAADSQVGESVQKPAKYFRNNIINTLNLLEAMQELEVGRFILSSTAAVFGEPEQVPITEENARQPANPYGESKLAIERLLPWYGKAYGLRWTSLRYFNAAGASDAHGELHDPETHLIPIVLQVALGQRKQVDVFGTDYPTEDGTCVRDYIHVIDLAQAHILALNGLEQQESAVYNLGSGAGFSVKQVIDTCREVSGRDIAVSYGPRRAGDPAVLVASSEKIHRELGWQPQYPELRQIVASAWKWHLGLVEGRG